MSLIIYRRHHTHPDKVDRCTSTDTMMCSNKKKPCPIWVKGTRADGTPVRESTKTRDWAHATRMLRQWEEAGSKPRRTTGPVKLEDLRDRFLRNLETEGSGVETIRKYKFLFRQWENFSHKHDLRFVGDFDLATLEDFRATWTDGALSRLKQQERLKKVFKYAMAHKMVGENPTLSLGKIAVDEKQVSPFTDGEEKVIVGAARKGIDAAKTPGAKDRALKTYALILLMRYSGLRISDATMLRRDALDGNHLSLKTEKNNTKVKVLLPYRVIEALRSFAPKHPDYFFWNGKTPLSALTSLYRDHYISPVFVAAKVNGHTHQFRHTFASRMLVGGTSVDDVAALLGNTAKIVLKHYADWVQGRQDALDAKVVAVNGYHELMPL